jgi:hypothetical protein
MESTNITNTVFSKLKPSNVNLDFSLLEAAFAEEPKAKPASAPAAGSGGTGGVTGGTTQVRLLISCFVIVVCMYIVVAT